MKNKLAETLALAGLLFAVSPFGIGFVLWAYHQLAAGVL
jgi:hypothetical protein